MKRKLFVLFLSIPIVGFSQSTTIDPRSLSVPRYASQTAITTAIPSPTVGMMVYNNASNQYAYWNGMAWTSLATGTSGPALWTLNSTTGRIEANTGAPGGIEASRFTSQSSSTLSAPLIGVVGGNGSTFLRYGRSSSSAAIFQESTTGFSSSSSSINWRFVEEPVGVNAPATVNWFGFSGNSMTFTVNGFSKLGDEATTTTSGVTRSSPAMKTILLTGALTPRANPETAASLTTTVPHGLDYNKIVDIKVLVTGVGIAGGFMVAEGFTDNRPSGALTGYQFSTITNGSSVLIIRNSGNSNNIAPLAGSVTATYKIFITYIP